MPVNWLCRTIWLAILGSIWSYSAFASSLNCSSEPDTLIATTPSPELRASSVQYYLKIRNDMPNNFDVLLIGDSIAANWSSSLREPYFNGLNVYNFGISGDRVQNVIWRFQNTDFSSRTPSNVVIFAGINNLADGVSPCGIAQGISLLVSDIKVRWPAVKIFLFEVHPHGQGYVKFETSRLELNSLLKDIYSGNSDVKVLAYSKEIACDMQSEMSAFEIFISNYIGIYHCENYIDDNIHLSPDGYSILGKMIKPLLK